MAQHLKSLAALGEDLGLVFNTVRLTVPSISSCRGPGSSSGYYRQLHSCTAHIDLQTHK